MCFCGLKETIDRINPPWCSDHLCWGQTSKLVLHDLLPLPQTNAVIDHVAERIRRVQDFLERPFAIENVSSYLTYSESTMPEWEFVSRVAEKANCGILFDCN